MKNTSRTILYISHGGGPLPILGDPSHTSMVNFLRDISQKIAKPEAIVVFSAHWEEKLPTITGDAAPALLYDYYGFPKEAYDIEYPVSGDPQLAKEIHNAFTGNSISSKIVAGRGLDHGVFIPLKIMYPEAEIPVIQISLVTGLSPEEHSNLGTALKSLAHKNLLIIGSGFSFHNMREFTWSADTAHDSKNDAFQDSLISLCTGNGNGDYAGRLKKLKQWESLPHARYCHPREEHLLPLHVCCALSEETAELIFDDYILGKRSVAFKWTV